MLKIKLARFGKKGQPHYRIVVNEARTKRDGAYVAKLGEYAPTLSPKILNLDLKAYGEWLAKGAQPTETVAALAKRAAKKDPFPTKKPRLSKKARAKVDSKTPPSSQSVDQVTEESAEKDQAEQSSATTEATEKQPEADQSEATDAKSAKEPTVDTTKVKPANKSAETVQ